jgi:hypothetical protein
MLSAPGDGLRGCRNADRPSAVACARSTEGTSRSPQLLKYPTPALSELAEQEYSCGVAFSSHSGASLFISMA